MALQLTHLWWSISLTSPNLSGRFRAAKNPFTGEDMKIPIDDPLSEHQMAAFRSCLEEHRFDYPVDDEGGFELLAPGNDALQFLSLPVDFGPDRPVSGIECSLLLRDLDVPTSGALLAALADVCRAAQFIVHGGSGDGPPPGTFLESSNPLVQTRYPGLQRWTQIGDLKEWLRTWTPTTRFAVEIS